MEWGGARGRKLQKRPILSEGKLITFQGHAPSFPAPTLVGSTKRLIADFLGLNNNSCKTMYPLQQYGIEPN